MKVSKLALFIEGIGDGTSAIKRGSDSVFLADKDARSIEKIESPAKGSIFLVENNSDSL